MSEVSVNDVIDDILNSIDDNIVEEATKPTSKMILEKV